MQNMIELKEAEEKVILAAVSLSEEGADASLDELEELEQDFPDAILYGSEKVVQMEKKLQSIRDEK